MPPYRRRKLVRRSPSKRLRTHTRPTYAVPPTTLVRLSRTAARQPPRREVARTSPASSWTFEAGARVGDGQTSLGAGALAFVDVSGWLVGFKGRVDRYQQIAGMGDGGVLEVGVLGGRRFGAGNVTLDLVGGLAAVLQGTSTYEAQSQGTDVTRSSSSTAPRLLLGARLGLRVTPTCTTLREPTSTMKNASPLAATCSGVGLRRRRLLRFGLFGLRDAPLEAELAVRLAVDHDGVAGHELASDDLPRQPVLQVLLDGALERSRAELRIPAHLGQVLLGRGRRDLER